MISHGYCYYSPEESCLLHLYTFSLNPSWEISCWGWPNPSHRPCAPAPVSPFCSPQLLLHECRTSCGAHEPTENGVGSGCSDGCSSSSGAKKLGVLTEWHIFSTADLVPCCFFCIHLISERKKSGWDGRKWWVIEIICDVSCSYLYHSTGQVKRCQLFIYVTSRK